MEVMAEYTSPEKRELYDLVILNKEAPTLKDLRAFQKFIKYDLPEDFISFVTSPYSGFHIEVKSDQWPDAEAFEVKPAWAFMKGLTVFSLAEVLPPEFQLRYWHEEMFIEHKVDNLLPFLKIETLNERYCFTETGNIISWDPQDPESREVFSGDFSDLLKQQLDELEDRRIRYAEGAHLK